MSTTIPAFDFIARPAPLPKVSTCVLFGPELFLKRLALAELRQRLLASEKQSDDVPVHSYDGLEATWRDVADELSTMSLFGGGGRRIVVVDDADKFVSTYRDKLEAYVAKPHKSSVLVLVVDSWASNTKLYKLVEATGLQIECRPPMRGKKDIDEGRVAEWMIERSAKAHDAILSRDAARLLLDLVGPEFGLLDQELAKLAVLVDRGGKITAPLVQEHAGAWRAKTTWDLVDAMLDGNTAEAFKQLDQLLQAGEEPIGVMAGVTWSLRRFSAATRIFENAERRGETMTLRAALSAAGVSSYGDALHKAERQLLQIGRLRAAKLYHWLLEIDLAQKSTHSGPARSRWQIEQLMLRLSRQMGPRRAS